MPNHIHATRWDPLSSRLFLLRNSSCAISTDRSLPSLAVRIPDKLAVLSMFQSLRWIEQLFWLDGKDPPPYPTSRVQLTPVSFSPNLELTPQTRIHIQQIIAEQIVCKHAKQLKLPSQ